MKTTGNEEQIQTGTVHAVALTPDKSMPVRSGSVDVITAAGSLNYADLGGFFEEY